MIWKLQAPRGLPLGCDSRFSRQESRLTLSHDPGLRIFPERQSALVLWPGESIAFRPSSGAWTCLQWGFTGVPAPSETVATCHSAMPSVTWDQGGPVRHMCPPRADGHRKRPEQGEGGVVGLWTESEC